jgi:hypothetical protein
MYFRTCFHSRTALAVVGGWICGNSALLFRFLNFSFIPQRAFLLKTSLRIEKRELNDNPLPTRVFSGAMVNGRLASSRACTSMCSTSWRHHTLSRKHLLVAEIVAVNDRRIGHLTGERL